MGSFLRVKARPYHTIFNTKEDLRGKEQTCHVQGQAVRVVVRCCRVSISGKPRKVKHIQVCSP